MASRGSNYTSLLMSNCQCVQICEDQYNVFTLFTFLVLNKPIVCLSQCNFPLYDCRMISFTKQLSKCAPRIQYNTKNLETINQPPNVWGKFLLFFFYHYIYKLVYKSLVNNKGFRIIHWSFVILRLLFFRETLINILQIYHHTRE